MSSTLGQLVLRRLAELGEAGRPMSFEVAAGRSRGLVSRATLNQLSTGRHSGVVKDDTLRGIALSLDVPVSEVYAAAAVQQPGSRWKWPARFDRLDPAQRRVVESVAAALLDAAERDPRQGR